jgi:beta-glucosidase
VQLYRLGHVSSVTVPMKQLFGFKRVFIEKGQKVRIQFLVDVHKWLGVWNQHMKWSVEPGERHFVVGPNSEDEWAQQSVIFRSMIN